MIKLKRFMSAALAAVITVSSFSAAVAFAADSTASRETTFDGQYLMSDDVSYYSYFYTDNNDTEVQEKLDAALKRQIGKSLDNVTFADLAKVTSLNLSGLNLVEVPACINYMVNLTRLDLSNNLLQSDALKTLSLLGCTELSNINLSNNYLTTIPSWFVSDRVTRGNITGNFVDSENPRCLMSTQPTYYLLNGETVYPDALQTQILKSIRFGDGKMLPEIFFDYNDPFAYDSKLTIAVDVDWGDFIDNGTVVAPTNRTVTVTVSLLNLPDNVNTKTTVTLYLLSDTDIASLKTRLESLASDCGGLSKDEYTENSYFNLERALDTAKAILEYANADGQMLTSALEGLANAKSKLRIGTKELQSTLKGLIATGGKYKQSDFSTSSWNIFTKALDELKKVSTDKNATLEDAKRAVKKFQSAQAGLEPSSLSVPDTIPKSEFQRIFGDNITITASGITSNGTRYKWNFNGKDLTSVADFNPEVKDTDASEADILIEAGSASDCRIIVTSGKDALPGKATLELNYTDKLPDGSYYVYKWDSAKKRSEMAGKAEVKGGVAYVPLTENGVYYLCSRIQNFNLVSSKYKIDDSAKTLTILPSTNKVSDFKKNLEYGSYTTVLDAEGKEVPSNSLIKNGMTVNAPNMDKYAITLLGDTDDDGYFDFDDLSESFKVLVNGNIEEKNFTIFDTDGNGEFDYDDILFGAKYLFGY